MIGHNAVFTDAFFKTRSFPDFQNVVLYIEDSAYIGKLFETCGINFCFIPPPIEVDFDPGFIPDCLVFDHKIHPQFIREQIRKHRPRKIVIVNTYPSKNNLRRFEAVLREFGYGMDAKFARETAKAISPRIHSCIFVLEKGAELMPNSFYGPRDMQPFGQGYAGFVSRQVTAVDGGAAAELLEIKNSRAYKASLALLKFARSNKFIFMIASAALSLLERYKSRGTQ